MTTAIVIYDASGKALPQALPLLPVVRSAMERILERKLDHAFIQILVFGVPDDARFDGDPILLNLCPDFGYARITVEEDGVITYNHPHRLQEILGTELQTLLRKGSISGDMLGYHLAINGMPRPPADIGPLRNFAAAHRATPEVAGSVPVAPYAAGEGPVFRIRKVAEPDPPEASIEDFPIMGGGGDRQAFVKVLVPDRLHADLLEQRRFSNDLEEGGFLVGRVFRDRDVTGTYLLELTAAVGAEHTGASLLHFTYTGDSFTAIRKVLREQHQDQDLIGWYHTHLFAATDAMGLSSIDLELHFTTFRRPWQLAGLINIDGRGPRVLRFYVRRESLMVPCPQWILR